MMSEDPGMEALRVNIQSLHANIHDLFETVHALNERSKRHSAQLEQDAENVRALVRIAEIHERRLTALEGGDNN